MTTYTFTAAERASLVAEVMTAFAGYPDLDIRACRDTDLMDSDATDVPPLSRHDLGMRGPMQSGLTLLALRHGRIIGQMSFDMVPSGFDEANVTLLIEGLYVNAQSRRTGAASALGAAAVTVAEQWRRHLAFVRNTPVEGAVDIACTLPRDAAGQHVIDSMIFLAGGFEEMAYDEAHGIDGDIRMSA